MLFCLATIALIEAVDIADAHHAAALAGRLRLAEEVVFIGVILAYAWVIRESDEFVRRKNMDAAAFAFIAVAILIPVFEILQRTGVFNAGLKDAETAAYLSWAGIMIFFLWRFNR